MLELVLGGSGSGKTTLLYQKMKERALRGEKSILIVPEQFTASTESRIYRELGDAYSGMVESFSFTSLAERVLGSCGGVAVKTLSDAGRAVLVRRAMKELQGNLHYYQKQRQNAAFCQMVAQTIDELKSAGVGAQQLADLAVHCGGGQDKIADLALIFAAYEAGITATALDPTDRVNLAAQQLREACSANETPMFLVDRAVFIDEFDTFNAPKKKLLGALFCAVQGICVALCSDGQLAQSVSVGQGVLASGQGQMVGADATALPEEAGDYKPSVLEDVSLFSGARRVAFDLRVLARKAGVGIAKPTVLQEDLRHANAPTLASLSALLEGKVVQTEPAAQPTEHADVTPPQQVNAQETGAGQHIQGAALSLFAAQSREEEARAAVAQMQRLARTGASYGKMAIVCRDLDLYRTAVRHECRLAEIPLFCDETTTPTFSAPVTAVRALLSILRGVDYTDQMIALAKTGLCGVPGQDEHGVRCVRPLPERQILALENYVYTWSPHRSAWKRPFTNSPLGFGDTRLADRVMDGDETEKEPPAETARKLLLAPVDALCRAVGKGDCSATIITKRLYQCLVALGAEEQQKAQVAALRKTRGIPESEAAAREWNVVMHLLDQMVQLLGEEEVSVAEYAELFLLLLNSCDLGHIPQNVDAVIFTSAGKMRLDAPEYVFVLGLAEGEFPAPPAEHGLLTDADRDALMAQSIELPDCFENKMVREDICFYKALTAPAKQLWMSWPEGLALPVTSALAPVMEQLAPTMIADDFWQDATTPAAALDRLGSLWGDGDTRAATLHAALEQWADGAPQNEVDAVNKGAMQVLEDVVEQAPVPKISEQIKAHRTTRTALQKLDSITQDAPKQLENTAQIATFLGNEMALSPSKIERYYTCQYAYFLQYMLRLRPRQKAELTPNHSGSLMHWVLEQTLTTKPTKYDALKPAPFVQLDAEQLKALGEGLVDAYHVLYMPDDSVRFGYLIARLKKSMVALLSYVQEELAQSAFAPAACEAKIGEADFPAPEYFLDAADAESAQHPTGRRVQLVGVIDRIDTWQDDSGTTWMRVVDYKTGQKSFSLKEVYDGLDCQMLLYLFAALHHWQNGGEDAKVKKAAAGVLYLLADPAPADRARNEAGAPLQPGLEGMLLEDDAVFQAVDAAQTGAYLPFAIKNGKVHSSVKRNKLADPEKMKRIEVHLDGLVKGMAQRLYAGDIAAQPLCTGTKNPCLWCEMRDICLHETGKNERDLTDPSNLFEAPKAKKEDVPDAALDAAPKAGDKTPVAPAEQLDKKPRKAGE